MKRMRVRIINRGVEGFTMCFKVVPINSRKVLTIGNCHRSDHPMWECRHIQCYNGNVEYENGTYGRASLLLYRNGDNLLFLK